MNDLILSSLLMTSDFVWLRNNPRWEEVGGAGVDVRDV